MSAGRLFHRIACFCFLSLLVAMAGCGRMPKLTAQECMTRVMYFESNRSSPDGMLAVGTVVMNRVHSGLYPKTVCGVVGQKKQFAPGVLSKPMGQGKALAAKTARLALRGGRHPEVGKAMFFHTAGYSYPYSNMYYVAIAGGNAFYEKRRDAVSTQASVMARESRLPFEPPQRRLPEVREAQLPLERREVPSPELRQAQLYEPDSGSSVPMLAPASSMLVPASETLAPPMLAPVDIEDIILAGG